MVLADMIVPELREKARHAGAGLSDEDCHGTSPVTAMWNWLAG
jgi:hypothetical protein